MRAGEVESGVAKKRRKKRRAAGSGSSSGSGSASASASESGSGSGSGSESESGSVSESGSESASGSGSESASGSGSASKSSSGTGTGTGTGTDAPRWHDLVLALSALAVFARGVPGALLSSWDDQRFLVEFEPVQSISVDSLVAIWSEPHFEAYHPLHLMSYWLDVPFAGASGPVQHGVSLGLFALTLLLVRRVLVAWSLPPMAALLATLAYALHPIQVEAVTWATGRKEIVALMFVCVAILQHERARGDGPWSRHAWLSRLAYAAAVLAKTTALPLPLVLAARELWVHRGPGRRVWLAQLPTLVLMAALSYVVVGIWEANEMIRPPPPGLGRVLLVFSTLTHHLGTAALPLETSPVYALHRVMADFGWYDGLGALAIVLLLWRGDGRVRFGTLAFLCFFAPVSNALPLYFEVQDRYLSLPLLPLAYLLGLGLARVSRSALLGAPIAIGFAALTVLYQGAWKDDLALWTHASATHPDSFYAWMKLGEVRRNTGDLGGAEQAYRRAVGAEPALRLGHAALFQALAMQDERELGLDERAVPLSQRYLRGADDYDRLRTLAGDMIELGYRDAALLPLGRALDIHPLSDDRLENAAAVQLDAGHPWLARFYVQRMTRTPFHRGLVRFARQPE